jgi:hypothetical protein
VTIIVTYDILVFCSDRTFRIFFLGGGGGERSDGDPVNISSKMHIIYIFPIFIARRYLEQTLWNEYLLRYCLKWHTDIYLSFLYKMGLICLAPDNLYFTGKYIIAMLKLNVGLFTQTQKSYLLITQSRRLFKYFNVTSFTN